MALVAWYYYQDGLTQGEIGDMLGISRIKVSRLLDRGRQTGIIQVTINSPYAGCFRQQRTLIERFGLRDARVVPALGQGDAGTRVALAAAQLLMQKLEPGELLSIGWGETVSKTLQQMTPLLTQGQIELVSLTGGVATYLNGSGFGKLSNIHLIPTPLRVSSSEFANALRDEPFVRDIIDMALTSRVALVGVGSLSHEATLVRSDYCSRSELSLFRRQGAVGDILGFFYDAEGKVLPLDLHDHVVSVSLDRLASIDTVIGAAAGVKKADAILGAMRGGYINTLVTDQPTAEAILERSDT
nr:sugar-binding domain-containing protein [Halovulum dunhuangense]